MHDIKNEHALHELAAVCIRLLGFVSRSRTSAILFQPAEIALKLLPSCPDDRS